MEVAPVLRRSWIAASLLSAVVVVGGVSAGDVKPEVYNFGTLRSTTAEAARTQAQDWLVKSRLQSEATQKQFDSIWARDASVLDKVAATLALDPEAAKLLKEVGDITTNVPKEVPALLKGKDKPTFYRANLSLLFAKAISSRRVYEEALDALKSVKPEDVVDPSAYFFHKAVAEHALTKKDESQPDVRPLVGRRGRGPVPLQNGRQPDVFRHAGLEEGREGPAEHQQADGQQRPPPGPVAGRQDHPGDPEEDRLPPG